MRIDFLTVVGKFNKHKTRYKYNLSYLVYVPMHFSKNIMEDYGSIALLWHNAKVLALVKLKWEIH